MKVAVLGYGTVGAGVYSMLSDAPGMEAGPVIVRPGKAVENFMVSDAALIFGDPTVDAVVETLGGLDPAYSYGMRALEAGKHFITANKAMVAAHGLELAALAREKGAAFLFSAACGGGVPFLHNLALSAETDRIEAVSGILNGTTNYMLDAMQRRSLSYGDALREAQSLGYAESDPTADVSGLDALRKMQLACAVAFGVLPQRYGALHRRGRGGYPKPRSRLPSYGARQPRRGERFGVCGAGALPPCRAGELGFHE